MKSVAMAYYNGAKYIDEQIRSILANMEDTDELIISVDDASDGSETILQNWAQNDPRIRIIKGPGKGVVKNFENAFRHCRGDIIFLSDQDDVWKKNKMIKIQQAFEDPKVMAVVHDAQIVDEKLSSLNETTFEWRDSKAGFWKNMKKNSYIGCCMAVRRSALKRILPIPDNIWIHSVDRIACRTARESGIYRRTSDLLSKTWGKCYGIDPWFDHIHDQKKISYDHGNQPTCKRME